MCVGRGTALCGRQRSREADAGDFDHALVEAVGRGEEVDCQTRRGKLGDERPSRHETLVRLNDLGENLQRRVAARALEPRSLMLSAASGAALGYLLPSEGSASGRSLGHRRRRLLAYISL